MSRKPYPSDLTEDEWAFVAPYLTLMKEAAPQREHSPREVFNALRWLARAGAPWRMLPQDFRRLARDFERMPEVLASLHFVVFAILMLPKAVMLLAQDKVHNTL